MDPAGPDGSETVVAIQRGNRYFAFRADQFEAAFRNLRTAANLAEEAFRRFGRALSGALGMSADQCRQELHALFVTTRREDDAVPAV